MFSKTFVVREKVFQNHIVIIAIKFVHISRRLRKVTSIGRLVKSIVVAGVASSPVSGTMTDGGYNSSDYWVIKLAPEELAVDTFTSTSQKFSLYPSPVVDYITVKFNQINDELQVDIYNFLMQKVNTLQFNTASTIAFPFNENRGIYFIKMTNEKGIIYQTKFLKN